MTKIYYVGARLSFESNTLLWRLGLAKLTKRAHATIIYSRQWFPYKEAAFFPLIIEPPYTIEVFGEIVVLRFNNSRFLERHVELRNAGASSAYESFKPHISIGFTTPAVLPDFPITFEKEYYSTWEE